jgi:acetyl-CoA carboxylase carboxyltransferase component
MGLEGAVKLGFRKELEAIDDPEERQAELERRVGEMAEAGSGLNVAMAFEIDDVIDPADSSRWVTTLLF